MGLLRLLLLLLTCSALCSGLFAETQSADLPKGFFPPPEALPQTAERSCLVCNGKGIVESELFNKDNRSINRTRRSHQTQLAKPEHFMVPCKACKGRKTCVRKLTLQERVEAYRQQRATYENAHTLERHQPIGAAYLEKAVADALDPETFATLAARYPAACKKCYGFGVQSCSRCDSLGFTRKEKVLPETGEKVEEQEPCTACDGTGEKACKTCERTGLARLCKRCNGLGVVQRAATKRKPGGIERCASCDGMCRR